MTTALDLQLLGGFAVRRDGHPAPAGWEHRRAADLVALLALAPGRRAPRERVVDALWPDLAPEAGAANLHKAAHHARRTLGDPAAVVLRTGVVALFPDARLGTDVARFEHAARRALATGDRTACAAAADLHSGELLPDRIYDEWTVPHRERLRATHLRLLRAAERWQDVADRDPTDEAAHRAVMRDHVTAGNRHAALRQFQRLRAALADELGVRPDRESAALYREIVAELARTSDRPAAPLIGREVTLARLRSAARAGAGRGTVLLLAGEAGMGKTRVCEAFCAQAERAGFGVLRASGADPGAPYGVARQMMLSAGRAQLDRLPEDARAAASAQPPPDPAAPRTRQQLAAVLARLCAVAERGTVLLVDDAQLADDDSVGVLDLVVSGAGARGVLLLLAFRPDRVGPALETLRARPDPIAIALPALSRDESHELVSGLCPDRPPAEDLERVWHLAAGNPFFTTELATTLASGTVAIPATLGAVVDARLTGCGPHVVERLRRVATAAVDGTYTFDTDEFLALTGWAEPDGFAALDEALAAGVLVVDGDGYRFRHALVAHHLAEGVAPHRRAQIHRAAADALASRHASPGRIARHLLAAGRRDEAVPWLIRAATDAGSVSAYADALEHVQQVLVIAPDRLDALALRAEYLLASGDPTAAVAYGEAAAVATGTARDALQIGRSWALLTVGDVAGAVGALADVEPHDDTRLAFALASGMAAWFTGRIDDAASAAAQSLTLSTAAGDRASLVKAAFLQALVAHSSGRWPGQFRIDLFDPRLEPVLGGVLSDAHLCAVEMYLYGEQGPQRVAAVAERLRDTAARAGAARGEAFATTLLGEAAQLCGDLETAEQHLLDGARKHRTLGARGGEAVALHRLAELAVTAGRTGGACLLLDQALEAARLSPLSAPHLLARIYGTRIRASDDEVALTVLDQAEGCLVRPAELCPADRVPYLLPASGVLARTGRLDAAEELLATAQTLVGMLWSGGGGWAAAVTEARAELCRARGHRAEAGALLATAERAFTAVGQPLDAARCRAAAG